MSFLLVFPDILTFPDLVATLCVFEKKYVNVINDLLYKHNKVDMFFTIFN